MYSGRHYWPISVDNEEENPDYIPPHEQWAFGKFMKNSKILPLRLEKIKKLFSV